MSRHLGPIILLQALLSLVIPVSTAFPEEPIQMVENTPQPGSKESKGAPSSSGSPFSFGWDVTLTSKYLFQGVDYSDGQPVIQPELFVTYKAVSATVWSNYDTDIEKANEHDFYLQYDQEFEGLSLTAGYAHLQYPYRDGWDPSQEVFLDLTFNHILNPSLSIHYDFDAGEGAYATLGMSHEMESPVGPLSLGTNLYYQDNYYGVSGIPSMEFSGSAEYGMGPLTVTPSLSYILTWDNGDFPESCDCLVSDTWLFSVNISQSF